MPVTLSHGLNPPLLPIIALAKVESQSQASGTREAWPGDALLQLSDTAGWGHGQVQCILGLAGGAVPDMINCPPLK